MLTEQARLTQLDKLQRDESDPRHGTTTGYRYGCRCDACREARMEYQERYRAARCDVLRIAE